MNSSINRIFAIALAVNAAVVIHCGKPVWAQNTVSDSVFIDAFLTATPNNPDPQTLFLIPEPNPEGTEQGLVIPLRDILVKPGYVVLLEANEQPSDYLVSVTGASFQFYSDGSPNFPPNLTGIPQLGVLFETGAPQNVGQFFNTGNPLITPSMIQVFSDLNVPEPSTLLLLALGVVGLLAHHWRRKKLSA